MPRFAAMLQQAYEQRGHRVEVWSPAARVFNWVPRGRLSKWAGYVDQYVLFPAQLRDALQHTSQDALFVLCDQALGPWLPMLSDRPHVVHVHDLLALRSALGAIPENPLSITGRIYQKYIRRGFRRCRNFISVSKKTRDDLHEFGQVDSAISEVVYNGMNYPYSRLSAEESAAILSAANIPVFSQGMLLHVGGGQWYKNLAGVIAIYAQYAALAANPLPLLCVSPEPNAAVRRALAAVPSSGVVRFVNNLESRSLQALYSTADAFLFPSLAEGFGWPLAEAQACGCPVITTDEPPMNEVGGPAACYLPKLRSPQTMQSWAKAGAQLLQALLSEDSRQKAQRRKQGQEWAARFDTQVTIDRYLEIYQRVLKAHATPDRVQPSGASMLV
jgi:glycosyltransferase involved in cell wall biosynthesis